MDTCYGREDILEQISNDPQVIVNIYGEPGLGKSALLSEAKSQIESTNPRPFVAIIDFKKHFRARPPEASILLDLLTQISGGVPVILGNNLQLEAGRTVTWLVNNGPCFIFFDSTEYLQENHLFWDWFERYFLIPLLATGQVQLIFAGRIHAPFRDYFVRKAVQIINIRPLEACVIDIVENILAPMKIDLLMEDGEFGKLCGIIADVSCGNLSMLEWLCEYAQDHFLHQDLAQFKQDLYRYIVLPNTNTHLLGSIPEHWKLILWQTSLLKHFDQGFVKCYLEVVAPTLVGVIPGIKNPQISWAKDVFPLYINAIIYKDSIEIIISDTIQKFLYQSWRELDRKSLIDAYRIAIALCTELADQVKYDMDAYNYYIKIKKDLETDLNEVLGI